MTAPQTDSFEEFRKKELDKWEGDQYGEEYKDPDTIVQETAEFTWTASRVDAEKKIEALEKRLEQQLFDNKHNLSIDQQIADKIENLEAALRVARSYRGK